MKGWPLDKLPPRAREQVEAKLAGDKKPPITMEEIVRLRDHARKHDLRNRPQAPVASAERRMNKTETRYSWRLDLLQREGEIVWYAFESMRLRLADKTWYLPDFAVLASDGVIEIHEVKGHWEDDARVKIKVAAEMYPFRFLAVQAVPQKKGGGWKVERFEGWKI